MQANLNAEQSHNLILNLAKYHREHEKFYAHAPLRTAIDLQKASNTLKTLADRWIHLEPGEALRGSPFAGCEDLNETPAIQHDGVLFMETEDEPAELQRMRRDLATIAGDFDQTGEWLANAMEASWEVALGLCDIPMLADVLGERHRIIANDWQAAQLSTLTALLLRRALDFLDKVDFAPEPIRADLAGSRFFADYLYSAAELVDRAADIAAESAALIHDNERRWRVFSRKVEQLQVKSAQKPDASTEPTSALAIRIKQALDEHPMTTDAGIQVVEKSPGKFALRGSIGSEDKVQVALDVAYTQKGVREIINELIVEE